MFCSINHLVSRVLLFFFSALLDGTRGLNTVTAADVAKFSLPFCFCRGYHCILSLWELNVIKCAIVNKFWYRIPSKWEYSPDIVLGFGLPLLHFASLRPFWGWDAQELYATSKSCEGCSSQLGRFLLSTRAFFLARWEPKKSSTLWQDWKRGREISGGTESCKAPIDSGLVTRQRPWLPSHTRLI